MAADPKTPWVGFGVGFGLGFGFGFRLGLVACVVFLWGEDFKVASVVLVLVAVGVVHVELGWEWDLGVVVVVAGCELAVEVRCGDGVALAGLVAANWR